MVTLEREPEGVIGCWTLVEEDWRLVADKSGASRLGFALLLKFFELHGRFARHAGEFPPAAVDYIAAQVQVDPTELGNYWWADQAIEQHRNQIRNALGLPVGDAKDVHVEQLFQDLCLAGPKGLLTTLISLGRLPLGEFVRGLAILEGENATVEAAISLTRRQLRAVLETVLDSMTACPEGATEEERSKFRLGRARAYFVIFIAWVSDHRGASVLDQHEVDKANEWLGKPLVAKVLESLYRPTEPGAFSRSAWEAANPTEDYEKIGTASELWDLLDLTSTAFWAVGTTSYVLRLRSRGLPLGQDIVALKCVGFRFGQGTSRVRSSALQAALAFEHCPEASPYLPAVYASTSQWVAMEFIEGPTLAEWVHRWKAARHKEPAAGTRQRNCEQTPERHGWPGPKVVSDLGSRLAAVIAGLHRLGLTHGDLNPKNIIVCGRRCDLLPPEPHADSHDDKERDLSHDFKLRLVDRGRNFSSMDLVDGDSEVTWFEPPEARWAAETEEAGGSTGEPRAANIESPPGPAHDFFSFGRVVEYLLAGEVLAGDELIPLSVYSGFPLLARLLDDLLDPSESRRLTITTAIEDPFRRMAVYETLLPDTVRTQAKLGILTEPSAPTGRRLRDRVARGYSIALQTFGLRDISLRLVREVYPSKEGTAPKHIDHLAVFALISALGFALCFIATLGGLAADYGHRASLGAIKTLLSLPSSTTLGGLFRPGAPIGATVHNNPAHIVGFSYAVAGFGYYQIIFAACAGTPLPANHLAASRAFRSFLRSWCLVPTAVIITANLFWPQLWLYCAGAGGVLIFAMNLSADRFEKRAWSGALNQLDEATGARASMQREHDAYRPEHGFLNNWILSSAGYCLAIFAVAVGVSTHHLHDIVLYEAVMTGANLLLLYRNAIVTYGPQLRGRLCRAFVLEERLGSGKPSRP
jgi:serine/threonine protein kinase